MCLVGRQKERKKWWGLTIFSSSPPNYNLSKIERTFVHVKRIFGLWYFATRSSFFFFFSFSALPTSFNHFGLLFLLLLFFGFQLALAFLSMLLYSSLCSSLPFFLFSFFFFFLIWMPHFFFFFFFFFELKDMFQLFGIWLQLIDI